MNARRLPWLLTALAATVTWAALGDPAEATPAPTATGAPLPVIRSLQPRIAHPDVVQDPFAAAVPAAVEPAPAAPSGALAAPNFSGTPVALPWRVIGKQLDADGWSVFLAQGEDTLIVRAGDTLDDHYRVTAIAPPTLTLQSLRHAKQRRTLDIGDAAE